MARIVETAFGTLGNFQHLACITEKDAAGSGELDGAGAAFKEGGAELFFEVADLLAHRWVGDVEVFGGFGEIEVFGDGKEAAQLVGIHGAGSFLIGKIYLPIVAYSKFPIKKEARIIESIIPI